jgi:hypothetical protein
MTRSSAVPGKAQAAFSVIREETKDGRVFNLADLMLVVHSWLTVAVVRACPQRRH